MSKDGGGGGGAYIDKADYENVKKMFVTIFGKSDEKELDRMVSIYMNSTNYKDFEKEYLTMNRGMVKLEPYFAKSFFSKDGNSKINAQEYLDEYYEYKKKSELQSELIRGMKNGNIRQMQDAVNKGAKVTNVYRGVRSYPFETALSTPTENIINVVQFMLDNGADPNETYMDKETVLMQAVRIGNPVIVRMLLYAGADPNLKNNLNKTASDIAQDLKKFEIKEIIDRFQIEGVTHILNERMNFHDFGVVEDMYDYIKRPPPPPPNNMLGGKRRKSRKTHKNKKNKRKTRRHKKN